MSIHRTGTEVSAVNRSTSSQQGPGRPKRGGRGPEELQTAKAAVRVQRQQDVQRGPGVVKYLSNEQFKERREREFYPDDFHVAISDDNGHDTKIAGIRWHPLMANEMNMLIARQNFPIETVHDLIRLSVFEMMKLLYELERKGGVPNYIVRLKTINRIALQSQQNREFEDTLRRVNDEVASLLAKGRKEAAAMFVHDVLVEAKQIPQKSWRDYYVDNIMRAHGSLLKEQSKGGVKLRRRSTD